MVHRVKGLVGIKKIWVMMSVLMTNLEKELGQGVTLTVNCATNNFAKGGKLGDGGFRGVYKGLLSESNVEIAVKRVSRGSK